MAVVAGIDAKESEGPKGGSRKRDMSYAQTRPRRGMKHHVIMRTSGVINGHGPLDW